MLPQRSTDISEIVKAAREFKSALDKADSFAMNKMAVMWQKVHSQINDTIQKIVYDMSIRQGQGKEITLQWVNELTYYKQLRNQVVKEINTLKNEEFIPIIKKGIEDAAISAVQQSTDLLSLATVNSEQHFNSLAKDEVAAIASGFKIGAPLKELFQPLGYEAMISIRDSLMNGISMGLPVFQIGRNMAEASNIALNRALTIARTEINRAHRQATQQVYEESGVVERYMRMANKATACMACLMLDGEVFDAKEAFNDHPNGGCVMLPIVQGMEEPQYEKGKDYFMKLSPAEQEKRMGKEYYKYWKKGDFKLEELATYHHSEVWGDSPQTAKLSDISYGYMKALHEAEFNKVYKQEIKQAKQAAKITKAEFDKLQTPVKPVEGLTKAEIEVMTSKVIPYQYEDTTSVRKDQSATKDRIVSEILTKLRQKSPYGNWDYGRVNNLVHQWAITSNDNNEVSLMIQKVASEVFGTKMTKWQQAKYDKNVREATFAKLRGYTQTEIKEFVEASYENTQIYFKSKGITHVNIYRGVTVADDDQLAEMFPVAKGSTTSDIQGMSMELEGNVLQSWSSSIKVANDFASWGNARIVMEMTVPVERIYNTAMTGAGCLDGWELVLIGNPGDVVYVNKPKEIDQKRMKQGKY